MCQLAVQLPRTIDFREGENLNLCNSRVRWHFLHCSNLPEFLSLLFYFFLHTDLSIKEMKNLLYHGGIYITTLQLQHILMGKRHDAVPNETR